MVKKFILDCGAVLENLSKEQISDLDPILQDFLYERYNPILNEIEMLYIENSNLTIEDAKLNNLSKRIENFLPDKLLQKSKNLEESLGNYSSSTPTHLAYVLQALKNNKNLKQIMEGYTETNGLVKIGLKERFEEAFLRDFNRLHPKVIDQEENILDHDVFSSVRKYTELKSILSEIKNLAELDLKQRQNLAEKIESLQEELTDKESLIPIIKKEVLAPKLKLLLSLINQNSNLQNIINDVGVIFHQDTNLYKPTTYPQELKTCLNLSDQQLKYLISRYNQRSFVSVENALYQSLDAGKSGLRDEIFHVECKENKIKLQAIEYKCTSQKYLTDKHGEIIEDQDGNGKKLPLHKMSYVADLSALSSSNAKVDCTALPTQKVNESFFCEAVSKEGEEYSPPSILEDKRNYNEQFQNNHLNEEQTKNLLNTPYIEHRLSNTNLKILAKSAFKFSCTGIKKSLIKHVILVEKDVNELFLIEIFNGNTDPNFSKLAKLYLKDKTDYNLNKLIYYSININNIRNFKLNLENETQNIQIKALKTNTASKVNYADFLSERF